MRGIYERRSEINLGNILHDGTPVYIISTVADESSIQAELFTDPKDADNEHYHQNFCKGNRSHLTCTSVSLASLFPDLKLYTLFSGKDCRCHGVFRTIEDAKLFRKTLEDDQTQYVPLEIDFCLID